MTYDYDAYYQTQAGGGAYEGPLWQVGGAIKGYSGRPFQYGEGFRAFGRSLMRFAKPILKYLGKEALQTGVNMGSDILEGKDIKSAVKERLKETGTNIASDAVNVVKKKLTGRGKKQAGKGKKQAGKEMARRRRRRTRKVHKKTVSRPRRTIRRRRRTRGKRKALADIFG